MKKLLAAALCAVLAVGVLAGCGSNGSSDEGDSKKTAKVIDVDLTSEEYAFGVDKTQPELLEQVNTFINKIKEDGTLDEICDKYFGGGEPTPVESAALDESKDQLVVATNAALSRSSICREIPMWELIWRSLHCSQMSSEKNL